MKKQKKVKFRIPVPKPNQVHADRKKYNRRSYSMQKTLQEY